MSATEAARNFSEIVNRVRYQGTSYLIERGGEPVARLVPVGLVPCTLSDLVSILEGAPSPDSAYLDEVEALTLNQPSEEGLDWD